MRHGDHIENKLNKLGKKQVEFSSKYLEKLNISKIYCSPINRCKESACIASRVLKKDIIIDNRLREREKIASQREEKDLEWYNNYLNVNYSSSDPEGAKEFFGRIKDFVEYIIRKHDFSENVLLVGHSSTLYALAAYFYGVKSEAIWMALGNGSIVCFETKEN